jgi:hypothetical protein
MDLIDSLQVLIYDTLLTYLPKEVINVLIMKYVGGKKSIEYFYKVVSRRTFSPLKIVLFKNLLFFQECDTEKYSNMDNDLSCYVIDTKTKSKKDIVLDDYNWYYNFLVNHCGSLYRIQTFFNGQICSFSTYDLEYRLSHRRVCEWPTKCGFCEGVAMSDAYIFMIFNNTIYRKAHYIHADTEDYLHIGYLRGMRKKFSRRINFSKSKDEKVVKIMTVDRRLPLVDEMLILFTNKKMICYTCELKKKYTIEYENSSDIISVCKNNEFVFVLHNSNDISDVEKGYRMSIDIYELKNFDRIDTAKKLLNTIKINNTSKKFYTNDICSICAEENHLYLICNSMKIYRLNL